MNEYIPIKNAPTEGESIPFFDYSQQGTSSKTSNLAEQRCPAQLPDQTRMAVVDAVGHGGCRTDGRLRDLLNPPEHHHPASAGVSGADSQPLIHFQRARSLLAHDPRHYGRLVSTNMCLSPS